ADPRIPLSAYEPTFVRSLVMVPIRASRPIGAIGNYWARRHSATAAEVRLLQALADTTAVAMENVRFYGDLEARVRERTADPEAFSYAVSHDLRAPIRHVEGHASILLQDGSSTFTQANLTRLRRIITAASNMRDMVDGLLELSRTAQTDLRRVPVDLARIAREVARECEAGSDRPVEFVTPVALPATGDPTLLRVALQNLLGNAWKFSRHAEAPRVELGADRADDGQPVYFVRDNGAGF